MCKDLPDFFCIGAQKAGTTWLFSVLRRHPDIFLPHRKEVHFWDIHYARGIHWYREIFRSPGKTSGDITPAYALLGIGRITEIRALIPKLKIIYILRNPVERAWSAALMALRQLQNAVSFEGQPGILYEEVHDAFFLRQFRMQGSLARGDYATTIRRWRSVFPEEQLMVLKFDDLVRNPREFLLRVCEHIGVSSGPLVSLPESVLRRRIFSSDGHALRSSLRDYLLSVYEPRIKEVEALLGWDLRHWYDRTCTEEAPRAVESSWGVVGEEQGGPRKPTGSG